MSGLSNHNEQGDAQHRLEEESEEETASLSSAQDNLVRNTVMSSGPVPFDDEYPRVKQIVDKLEGAGEVPKSAKALWVRRLAREVVLGLAKKEDPAVSHADEESIRRIYDAVEQAVSAASEDMRWLIADNPRPLVLELALGTYLVQRVDQRIETGAIGRVDDAEVENEESETEALLRRIMSATRETLLFLMIEQHGQPPIESLSKWVEIGEPLVYKELAEKFWAAIKQPKNDFRSLGKISNREYWAAMALYAIGVMCEQCRLQDASAYGGDWGVFFGNVFAFVQNLASMALRLYTGMKEWSLLFTTDESVMLEGLSARINTVGYADAAQMQRVYAAFAPYTKGKELPPGTTPLIIRFLVVSAGVPGLWQKLDKTDPRLGDALIGCYGEGLGMTALAERLPGVNDRGMASYLVRRGLKKLFKWMPEKSDDFPIDKYVELSLDKVLATRSERQRAAGEKRTEETRSSEWGRQTVAQRWWPESGSTSPDD